MDLMNNNIQNNKYKLKPIIKYAIQSRLFIWIISLLSHIFVNEHDSSASLILSDNSQSYSTLDQIIIYIFGVFVRWDSFFFYHIAENGYIYEQETAFFPFLPYMMRILSNTSNFFFFFFKKKKIIKKFIKSLIIIYFFKNYFSSILLKLFYKPLLVLYPLQFILNYKCVLLISGVLIVNLSFILATITLYK